MRCVQQFTSSNLRWFNDFQLTFLAKCLYANANTRNPDEPNSSRIEQIFDGTENKYTQCCALKYVERVLRNYKIINNTYIFFKITRLFQTALNDFFRSSFTVRSVTPRP